MYGVERIPDIMLMKEMSQYHDGLNVDRLVSFAALVAFVRIQESNRGYKRIIEEQEGSNLDKSQNLLKLKGNPFSNLGGAKQRRNKGRRGYKNLR